MNKTSSLGRYFNGFAKKPLLSRTKELELARAIQKGDDNAKKILIESNLKLVVSVAKRYPLIGMSLADLIQEGNIGLIKATEKYNPESGFRFSTYATTLIKQSITEAINCQGRGIRVPSYVLSDIRKLRKNIIVFEKKYGDEPSIEDLSLLLNMSTNKIERLFEVSIPLVSLDQYIGDEKSTTLIETLFKDQMESRAVEDVLIKERTETIQGLLRCLTAKEQLVIEKHFALVEELPLTLKDIGDMMGITRERVRQLESRALKKMRKAIKQFSLDSYFEF